MSDMVRTQIYLKSRQHNELKRWARRLRTTESDLIRASVDAWLREQRGAQRRARAITEIEAYIDNRMAKGPLPGTRDWTREDIYNDAIRYPG